jgi:hypothetical protein
MTCAKSAKAFLFAQSGAYKIRTNERRFSAHCLRTDHHACYRNEERTAPASSRSGLWLCLSEIKLAHTDDEVRQEMA